MGLLLSMESLVFVGNVKPKVVFSAYGHIQLTSYSAKHSEGHPVCAPTPVCASTGTVHRVRGLHVQPFSMTLLPM